MEFCAFSCDANHVFWSPRHIPNIISAIRILLVAPIAVALADRQLVTTIILFGVAALSDAADGFLAKRYSWQSELGAVLDPAADKLLLVTLFITLAYMKLVPRWLMAAAVARDVIIVLGALLYRYWVGPLNLRPSVVSKFNTLRPPSIVPLWLWGGSGTGKTHLLQAVCAAAGEAAAAEVASAEAAAAGAGVPNAGLPAAGPPAAYFPLAGPRTLPPEALAGFERTRVLCVDDVDAVAGDLAWEQALFRLFNEASELRTRLIFAAAAPPRQPRWRLEDWGSRAAACVVYQLRELDDDGRIEALRLRAAQRGLQLPYETSEYLLKRMPRDMRSLFEILDQLDEASLVAQRRLTIPFIRDALERHARTKS